MDHAWAKSIYFKDPNDLSLEYCCLLRDFEADDATPRARFSIGRAALDLPIRKAVPKIWTEEAALPG
jgi:hypothetical protein